MKGEDTLRGRITADTIVAIAQDFDAHTMVLMGECVKTGKQLVQCANL
jgi:hypothetical protein